MSNEKTNIKKGISRFVFTGKLKTSRSTFKIDSDSANGFHFNSADLAIDCGNGVVYARMFGGYSNTGDSVIYLRGKKEGPNGPMDDYENTLSVKFSERMLPEVIEAAGPGNFTTVGLVKGVDGKPQKERFISQYDAISRLNDILNAIPEENRDDLTVRVYGDIEYQYYKGKVRSTNSVKGISVSEASEERFGALIEQTGFFKADDMLRPGEIEEGSTFCMHVPQYINKVNGDVIKSVIPLPIKLGVKMPNPNYNLLFNSVSKSNGYTKATIIGSLSASGPVENTEDIQMTDTLRQLVESGAISIEDIPPKTAGDGGYTIETRFEKIRIYTNADGLQDIMLEPSAYTFEEIDNVYDDFIKRVGDEAANSSETVAPKTKAEIKSAVNELDAALDSVDDDLPFDL